MLSKKFIGAVLLISGACIGAGMLALPIVMASLGLRLSIISLTCVWFFSCFTGLLVIEANLGLAPNTNYISMANSTLGYKGKVITWITYMLLLYSLLAAYTTVGGDLLYSIESKFLGHGLPYWASYMLWTVIFAAIIYAGIDLSETLNKLLILGLIISFSTLAAIITPHINPHIFHTGHARYIFFSLPVVAAAFGYHIIIPSIRDYLKNHAQQITWAVILGTFLPLCLYIYWVYLIFGVIPVTGEHGLLTILHSGNPTEILTQTLTYLTQNKWLAFVTRFFIFFAITSSVIAVALGLFDLLTDGLKIKRNHPGKLLLVSLTFIPPLLYALIYPAGFILALGYAGIFVAILHGILPVAMVWAKRYHYWQEDVKYKVFGGKVSLLLVFLLSLVIIFSEIGENLHWIPME